MRVGLYSLMPTQWKTMRQVARLLRDSGRYVPVVFFDRNAGNRPYERDVRACLADGIECHDAEGAITEGRVTDVVARDPRPRSIAIRALHAAFGRSPRLWDGLIEPLVAFPEQYTHYRERIAFATRWLEEQRIDLLVAPGDSTSYDTPAWIEAGHRLGVSTVIVPFSTNTPAGVAADISRFPEHDATRWFNRIVSVVAPHWIYQNLVRESAGKIFALSALGLAPPRPWILHSGNADRILVDTEHTRAEFVDSGLAADRITVTGALSDDTLALSYADADARRFVLARELGFSGDRPLVLASLCDYSRYFTLSGPQEGFASARELVEFWVRTLVELGTHDVVLSLHPWMSRADWTDLERTGARISDRTIEELVPVCELFAVSVSVTVRLAIACRKPVVDHDVLHFRIAGSPGVVVETAQAFRDAVTRLVRDPGYVREVLAAQEPIATGYRLDGRAGQRMLAVFDELTERRARAVAAPRSSSPSRAS